MLHAPATTLRTFVAASLFHHALLGLSMAALGAAGLRLSSLLAPAGLARGLAAAPLAVAAAVAETLALGLAGLGGSSVVLSGAALLTWLAVRTTTPAPKLSTTEELLSWWRAGSATDRALLGALGGGALIWAVWQLRVPQIGFDSQFYHLPEIVLWVQSGHPGVVENVLPGLPVGNYPLTDEVTVAWATGIARSFVPFMLWPWVTLLITACAGWEGLRALRVPPLARGLAVAALCTSPWLLAWQSHGTMTDPAALCWLVCGAALFALGRDRPELLAPALLAVGLSVGVKTTTLPLGLVVVALGLAESRRHLRGVRVPLVAALVGALAVGGVWYVRNLLDHGSPFWPIIATPWGEPVPQFIAFINTSFVDRPAATIDQLGGSYVNRFSGGLIVLVGGVLVPMTVARRAAAVARRGTLAAAAVTAVALLIWIRSPLTGIPRGYGNVESVFSTTRYLLPAIAAGAVALGLVAAERRRHSAVALVALLAAVLVNFTETFELGFPTAPAPWIPAVGAALGAVLAVLIARRASLDVPRLAAPLLAVALGALLALPARGLVARHGATHELTTAPVVNRLVGDREYRTGASPVATNPLFIGVLAGDDLRHRLEAIPAGAPCSTVGARARTQWLVVYANPGPLDGAPPLPVGRCLPGVRATLETSQFHIYRPQAGLGTATAVVDRRRVSARPRADKATPRCCAR